MLRLNLVYYGNHNSQEDLLIMKVRPEYLIGNPPHGLWGEINGYSSQNLLQNVSGYQGVGIKVIGYVTGGYEGKGSGSGMDRQWYTLEMNQKLVRNMARFDRVDGVFIDECSAFPASNSRKYLKTLTDLAHRLGLIAWGNVGSADFDDWYFTEGGFDLMNSSEDWYGQSLSRTQAEWAPRVSVTGSNLGYTVRDAYELTVDAWHKGLAYCYISNSEYLSLPPWVEEYAVSLLARQTER